MSVPRVISSDSHVVEPPNVWVERMDHSKFGDRIPHLVKGDPYDFWYADAKKTSPVGAITQAGLRFDRPQDIVQGICGLPPSQTAYLQKYLSPRHTSHRC